jgi:hypothetical protein
MAWPIPTKSRGTTLARKRGAPIRFTLGASGIAMIVAAASPAFKANPMLGNSIDMIAGGTGDLRRAFPETLEKATQTLRGR